MDVAELLPKYFASDLKKFTEENGLRFVFFLDVYDSILEMDITREAISNQEKWLFDQKKGLFHHLNNTLFVLTGRDEILWMKNSSNLKDVYSSKKLDKLEPEEIKALLESISEVEIRERFESITKGHPYTIDRAIDVYKQKENLSSEEKAVYFSKIDSPEVLENYFFENMLDREKTLLTLFSLCNFWNEEIFLFLNDTFKLGYSTLDFPKIINHSYVETSNNENFTLHSLMVESFQKRCDQKTTDLLHTSMFEYYQKKLKGIENRSIMFEDEKIFREAIYHNIELKKKKNNNELFVFFVQWFLPYAKIYESFFKFSFLISLYEKILQEYNSNQQDYNFLNSTSILLNNLGQLYKEVGEYSKAIIIYKQSLSIDNKLFGSESPETAITLNNLGHLYKVTREFSKALPLYEHSLKILELAFGNDYPGIAKILDNLGNLYLSIGDYKKALSLFTRAKVLFEQSYGPEHLDTAISLNNLGYLYLTIKDYQKALLLCPQSMVQHHC